jgi:hypothetical protein
MWFSSGLTVGREPQMQERLASTKLGQDYEQVAQTSSRPSQVEHLHPEEHGAAAPRLVNVAHRVDKENKPHNGRDCSANTHRLVCPIPEEHPFWVNSHATDAKGSD